LEKIKNNSCKCYNRIKGLTRLYYIIKI